MPAQAFLRSLSLCLPDRCSGKLPDVVQTCGAEDGIRDGVQEDIRVGMSHKMTG